MCAAAGRVRDTGSNASSTGKDARSPKWLACSIANEIVGPRGTALHGPATGPPIVDKAKVAHDSLEARSLAHGLIGGVPEPGRRNRLKIVAPHLVLIELQHALGRSHMPIRKAHVADARQGLRRSG